MTTPAISPAHHAAMPRARTAGITPRRLLGAACLAAFLALAWTRAPAVALAAWLAAGWFWLGTMLGLAVNARVHRLTGGRWGRLLAPATRAGLRPVLPLLALVTLPVVLGARWLYPWVADPSAAHGALQHAWFTAPWPLVRALAYAAACAALVHAPRTGARESPGRAAAALVGGTLLVTLLATEAVMSLTPTWSSTVFGWLAAATQWTSGVAVAVAVTAANRARRRGGAEDRHRAAQDLPPSRQAARVPVLRDLGNLLLMLVGVQAYLQFMQFLVIWAEDLPRETSWYLPRMAGAWGGLGAALVVAQAALPLLLLLWRRNKDEPWRLAAIAGTLAVAQALGAAWTIVPSVAAARGDGAVMALWALAVAGLGLLLAGGSR